MSTSNGPQRAILTLQHRNKKGQGAGSLLHGVLFALSVSFKDGRRFIFIRNEARRMSLRRSSSLNTPGSPHYFSKPYTTRATHKQAPTPSQNGYDFLRRSSDMLNSSKKSGII